MGFQSSVYRLEWVWFLHILVIWGYVLEGYAHYVISYLLNLQLALYQQNNGKSCIREIFMMEICGSSLISPLYNLAVQKHNVLLHVDERASSTNIILP